VYINVSEVILTCITHIYDIPVCIQSWGTSQKKLRSFSVAPGEFHIFKQGTAASSVITSNSLFMPKHLSHLVE